MAKKTTRKTEDKGLINEYIFTGHMGQPLVYENKHDKEEFFKMKVEDLKIGEVFDATMEHDVFVSSDVNKD